jgi:hypothetical protein
VGSGRGLRVCELEILSCHAGDVTPREPDIWKPPPDKTFTKGEVDRAGKLIARFFHEERDEGAGLWDEYDKDQVFEAMEAVTWWKQLHAVPLSRVAANLRYHVGQENGELDGKIDVDGPAWRRAPAEDEFAETHAYRGELRTHRARR